MRGAESAPESVTDIKREYEASRAELGKKIDALRARVRRRWLKWLNLRCDQGERQRRRDK